MFDPLPERPLVSVVMPAYNAGPFIAQAVRSVQEQTWPHWQLIIVNDGSTDDTAKVMAGLDDPRIRTVHQPNRGVSAARNAGLELAEGALICFLDADDRMPTRGLEARLDVLRGDPGISFADGAVRYYDARFQHALNAWAPDFRGEPFPLLIRFDARCFFGNTWMIRREALGDARFEPGLTHAEDLLFYLNIAPGRRYDHTREEVLHYRRTGATSMAQVEGLERGYHRVLGWMREHPQLVSGQALRHARWRVKRMVSGSYWHAGKPWQAITCWLR